jgi:Flp pilus assembly protein TadG
MFRRHRPCRRRGANLVEAAIVYPVVLLLLLGVIVVGLGMFRYNQVAELAREGARWASVRGAQYSSDTGNAAATSTEVGNYVKGLAAGLDPNSLTVTTTWNTSNALTHTSGNLTIKNTVSVTVSYPWIPEAFFGGATLTMQSTSVMTMNY